MCIKVLLTTKGPEGTHMQKEGLDPSHTTGEVLTLKMGLFKLTKTLSNISKCSASTQGGRCMK